MIRRLLPTGAAVILLSTALAGSALAGAAGGLGGGGGPSSPGQYHFEDSSAYAQFFLRPAVAGGGGGGPNFASVNVSYGLFEFEPDPDIGFGEPSQERRTVLSVFITGPKGGSGCYLIPDSDFSVADNLQSAELSTTVTADTPKCGKGRIVSAESVGLPGLAPLGGGGGGPELALPITVDITWAGRGPVWTFHNSGTSECLTYSTESVGTYRRAASTAEGTISAVEGELRAANASITDSSNDNTVTGHFPLACSF